MAKESTKPLLSRSPIIIVLVVLLLEMALVFLFVPKARLVDVQQREMEALTSSLGETATEYVKKKSDHYYYNLFVESGILPVSYDFLIGQWGEDETFDDRGFAKLVEQRLDVVWVSLNLAARRITTILLWVPYILPFLMAVIIDGLVEREIRKYRFAFASPAAHRTATIVVALVFWFFLTIPFLPFSVTPMLPAYLVWAVALAVWSYTSNMQKRM